MSFPCPYSHSRRDVLHATAAEAVLAEASFSVKLPRPFSLYAGAVHANKLVSSDAAASFQPPLPGLAGMAEISWA